MVNVHIVTHFICVLILTCFCIIMTMSNWASQFGLEDTRITLLFYLYTIFFLVGFLSIVFSWFRNARSSENAEKRQDQHTFLLAFGGMGLFFVGILIMNALFMINQAYCLQSLLSSHCDIVKLAGFILYHTSETLYLGAQLMFIVWVRYNRLNRGFKLVSKLAHSVNIAVNLALIIYCSNFETRGLRESTMDPKTENFFNCNKKTNHTSSFYTGVNSLRRDTSCVIGNTTMLTLNGVLSPYTFPMQVQFASLAISVMIGQVAIATVNNDNVTARPSIERHNEVDNILAYTIRHTLSKIRASMPSMPSVLDRLRRRDSPRERTPLLGIVGPPSAFSPLLVAGLFLCCIQIISGVVGNEDLSSTVWFVLIVNLTWYFSMVVASICVLVYMYKHTNAVLRTPLPSSAVVILLSSACAYNLNFYQLIANSDILTRPSSEWEIIKHNTSLTDSQLYLFTLSNALAYGFCIIRVVLQSLIIIRICRELSMSRYCLKLTGNVRTSLYYLLVANITNWLWNTVMGISLRDAVKIAYYSEDVWMSLQRVFMPGFMYFEFHSFTIMSEYMIAQWSSRARTNGEPSLQIQIQQQQQQQQHQQQQQQQQDDGTSDDEERPLLPSRRYTTVS